MFNGKELLEKIDELGLEVNPAVMKACGYSCKNKDNEEIPLVAGFLIAHAEANLEVNGNNQAYIHSFSNSYNGPLGFDYSKKKLIL